MCAMVFASGGQNNENNPMTINAKTIDSKFVSQEDNSIPCDPWTSRKFIKLLSLPSNCSKDCLQTVKRSSFMKYVRAVAQFDQGFFVLNS